MKFRLSRLVARLMTAWQVRTRLACVFGIKKAFHAKTAAVFLGIVFTVTAATSAGASVFDPILRVLLPFYQGSSQRPDTAPTLAEASVVDVAPIDHFDVTPTDDNIDITDLHPSNADAYSIAEPLGNLTDDNATPPSQPTNHRALDYVSSAAIGEPDLFVLLQAEFAADRGDLIAALQAYKGESFKRNATAVFERALGLSLQHETPAQSLAFAKAWQAQNPNHVPAVFYVAHLALRAQDYDTAAATLNQILAYDPSADLSQILTGIFPNTGSAQHALFSALRSTDSDQNVSLSVLKAGLLIQMGEIDAARLHVDNAIRLEPDNLPILIMKADILRHSDDANAQRRLREFLTQARQNTNPTIQKELYLYEIRLHIDNNALDQAWQLLKVASQRFEEDHELLLLASLVALDVHAYDEAIELLTKLTYTSTYGADAHYYLGIGYERTHQYALAVHHYHQVTEGDLVMDAAKKLVAYELMAERADNAIGILYDLRRAHPAYTAETYLIQADILERLNRHDEAITVLRQAVHNDPYNTQLLFGLVNLLEDHANDKAELLNTLTQLDPANAVYQLAQIRHQLAINPDDYSALTQAQLLADNTDQYANFSADIRSQSLKLLANHALQYGDYQAVINYLQEEYRLEPELEMGILLLRAYQGLGDSDALNSLLDDLQHRFGDSEQPAPEQPSDGELDTAPVALPTDNLSPIALDDLANLHYDRLPDEAVLDEPPTETAPLAVN